MDTSPESVANFHKKPEHFTYVIANGNALCPRTPLIIVYHNFGDTCFYTQKHFLNYCRKWNIKLSGFPERFVRAIYTLCARPLKHTAHFSHRIDITKKKLFFILFFSHIISTLAKKIKKNKMKNEI